jgi:hypothetical protein
MLKSLCSSIGELIAAQTPQVTSSRDVEVFVSYSLGSALTIALCSPSVTI